MLNRMCSLCGEWYTDETGHNYDGCVSRIKAAKADAKQTYLHLKHSLQKAKEIQKHDWWKEKL